MVISYAQGMALLKVASDKLQYDLHLELVAQVWSAGCIIRADFLHDIKQAYQKDPTLSNLLLDSHIEQQVTSTEDALRFIVAKGAEMGIAIPAFMASLSYLDGYSSGWMPANLIQAERDYFGSHTYGRTDEKGTFHTNWEQSKIV